MIKVVLYVLNGLGTMDEKKKKPNTDTWSHNAMPDLFRSPFPFDSLHSMTHQ